MNANELNQMIDQAAALKFQEKELATKRQALEDKIATYALSQMEDAKSIKLAGNASVVTVQAKTKDVWQPEVCKQIATKVPLDMFYKLFRVTFAGQKRAITKFMADTDDMEVRGLLKDACVSEPGRPYLKYEVAMEEAA